MTKITEVNYTPENVEILTNVYGSADSDVDRKNAVTELATQLGKTVNSIRAKLAKLGLYIKPAKTTKNGSKVVRKTDLVALIADEVGKEQELMDSLEKGTKFALEAINEHFIFLNRIITDLENSD